MERAFSVDNLVDNLWRMGRTQSESEFNPLERRDQAGASANANVNANNNSNNAAAPAQSGGGGNANHPPPPGFNDPAGGFMPPNPAGGMHRVASIDLLRKMILQGGGSAPGGLAMPMPMIPSVDQGEGASPYAQTPQSIDNTIAEKPVARREGGRKSGRSARVKNEANGVGAKAARAGATAPSNGTQRQKNSALEPQKTVGMKRSGRAAAGKAALSISMAVQDELEERRANKRGRKAFPADDLAPVSPSDLGNLPVPKKGHAHGKGHKKLPRSRAEIDESGLTVDEVRRQRRMLSNRESARRSRRRKLDHVTVLEGRIQNLEMENHALRERLQDLEGRYESVLRDSVSMRGELERSRGQGGSPGDRPANQPGFVPFRSLKSYENLLALHNAALAQENA